LLAIWWRDASTAARRSPNRTNPQALQETIRAHGGVCMLVIACPAVLFPSLIVPSPCFSLLCWLQCGTARCHASRLGATRRGAVTARGWLAHTHEPRRHGKGHEGNTHIHKSDTHTQGTQGTHRSACLRTAPVMQQRATPRPKTDRNGSVTCSQERDVTHQMRAQSKGKHHRCPASRTSLRAGSNRRAGCRFRTGLERARGHRDHNHGGVGGWDWLAGVASRQHELSCHGDM